MATAPRRTGETRRQLRGNRLAVMTIFFVCGATWGNWVPRIPSVQRELGLGDGTLGLALLGPSVGALITMPTTGWLIGRFGSCILTRITVLTLCAVLPLLVLAPSLPLLMLALVVLGASNGMLDVAMNAQAVAVERGYRRPIMSSFHGVFSAGGLAGSGATALVASLGVDAVRHLLGAAVVLGGAAGLASLRLLPSSIDAGSGGPAIARPSRPLVGLGVVAFCVLLGEGAMADWSAVYLRNGLGTGAGFAAAGYAAFSLAMATGRLSGDRLTAWLGAARLVRLGGALVAAGLGVSLIAGWPGVALVGFACVGAGLSCIFPIVLSAAARVPGLAPGTALAAIATVGYTGFLAGPPLIGGAAELVTLRGALGIVALLGAAVAVLAPAVEPRETASGAVTTAAT